MTMPETIMISMTLRDAERYARTTWSDQLHQLTGAACRKALAAGRRRLPRTDNNRRPPMRTLHLSEPSDDDGETLYTVTLDGPTGPSLIGIIVRDDDYTVIHWPDGETSWPVINGVALPAREG